MSSNLYHCLHCGMTYDWRHSPSQSLKMTYCGSLCERADLGFTIEALLCTERDPYAFLLKSTSRELMIA